MRCTNRAWAIAIAFALTVGVVAGRTSSASAQAAASSPAQVKADFKGIIGLGLVGAELGFILPAVAGVDDTWAFIVFPTIGAVGGGVAGYFLFEQGAGKPELAIASLAFGMAMIIPTMVITLSETAYDPSDEPTRDRGPTAAQGPSEQGTRLAERPAMPSFRGTSRRHRPRALEGGPGLLRLSDRGALMGVPVVSVANTFTQEEIQRLHVSQQRELQVPILSASF